MLAGKILINHQYKIIYLPIYKNATIETSGILLVYYNFIQIHLNELSNEEESNNINSNYDEPNIERFNKEQYYNNVFNMYPNYFIFTCCRNPYYRYNSAIKYLIKMGKKNSDKQDENINNIFINYKLNENLKFFTKNHLQEQYHYYHKCNYIIRLESYHEDLIKLLLKFDIPLRHIHILNKNIKLNNTKKSNNIHIDDDLINNINIFYKKDFEFYNYNIISNTTELNELFDNINYEDTNNIYNKYKNYFLNENDSNKFIVDKLSADNDNNYNLNDEYDEGEELLSIIT